MNLSQFVSFRRPAWQEMEALLALAENREATALPHLQARRFADLYRRVSVDLVQARTYGAGAELTGYLESLVARGYALLYPAPPLGTWRALWGFLRDRFPGALRREAACCGIVGATFAAGLSLGALAALVDPEAVELLVPAQFRHDPAERVHRDEQAGRGGKREMGATGHAAFSSMLFTHNIGVSITCFAAGIAWGVPTLFFIAYHGVFLSVIAVQYFQAGVGLFFLAWVLPHGIIEMTCILIAGTAGLLLGRGVLWPKGKTRSERVREEARPALELLGGAAVLLVFAGVIEGTLSQIHEPALPYPLKIGVALVLGALLHAYLWLLPPRRTPAQSVEPHQTAPLALSSR